jgi:DNA-binding MarR family transcriptional regulator
LPASLNPDVTAAMLREVIVGLIRRDGPALSAHQFGVFLTCYTIDREHTVRGLAADLKVSKSVITRALDKLAELDLAQRKPDPKDRRSVLVAKTEGGKRLVNELTSAALGTARGFAAAAD